LVVLLNLLGSVQRKRGELEEAMDIYELALRDLEPILPVKAATTDSVARGQEVIYTVGCGSTDKLGLEEMLPVAPVGNLLARAVSYREMGTIHEEWGETEEALRKYIRSLNSIAQYKSLVSRSGEFPNDEATGLLSEEMIRWEMERTRLAQSPTDTSSGSEQLQYETHRTPQGETEVLFGTPPRSGGKPALEQIRVATTYDIFFPPEAKEEQAPTRKERRSKLQPITTDSAYADLELAQTLHQIAQLHRTNGQHQFALEAFNAALKGMKRAQGNNHPNVAAVLGNIGNLQKEMGDLNAAFQTYQQVLGIESFRFGLSHPDVCVTLHNIATIDAARGNLDNALELYKQVLTLQKTNFGDDDLSLSVTSACMGDVHERLGDFGAATTCYEEALRIKSAHLGRHSLEVARLLHKLGKLSALEGDYYRADTFLTRAILIYRLNQLSEQDEWLVDAFRDSADVEGALALGHAERYEC
jgi:tetratricopeptide (TPR) repeat protein